MVNSLSASLDHIAHLHSHTYGQQQKTNNIVYQHHTRIMMWFVSDFSFRLFDFSANLSSFSLFSSFLWLFFHNFLIFALHFSHFVHLLCLSVSVLPFGSFVGVVIFTCDKHLHATFYHCIHSGIDSNQILASSYFDLNFKYIYQFK